MRKGEPASFSTIKPTKEGLKSTISGTNGTPKGNDAWLGYFERHRKPGYYVEASGSVEKAAIRKGIPTVSANDVLKVINKKIAVDPDEIHYEQSFVISGLQETHQKVTVLPHGH